MRVADLLVLVVQTSWCRMNLLLNILHCPGLNNGDDINMTQSPDIEELYTLTRKRVTKFLDQRVEDNPRIKQWRFEWDRERDYAIVIEGMDRSFFCWVDMADGTTDGVNWIVRDTMNVQEYARYGISLPDFAPSEIIDALQDVGVFVP